MSIQKTPHVFISATSADLSSYRQIVKDVLLTNGILPIEQTNFPPDFRSVEAMLESKIRDCDAVVCLVGFVYGAEPSDRPPDQPRRSYTQMEFDISRRLGKPVFQFVATDDCTFDARPNEDLERNALQCAHRKTIESGRQLWERFSNHDQLRQRIAHIQFGKPATGQVHPQNLPYVSLGTLFKGRESFLKTIREHLLAHNQQANGSHATAITQRQALCGLGGVGKTRLAVEYAWRYNDEYSATLFVVADSPENLRRNLAQLTGPLVLNLPEHNRQEEEVKMAAAIRWLEEHPGWFLILDNVDNRISAQAVEDLLARIPGGHVLITSRIGDWSKDVESLELDVLSSEDAKSFLLERTQNRRRLTRSDDEDAAVLGRELDGLALALEQAGAFIERQHCSIAEYLKRWKTGEARVRQWFDPRLMHYPRSVAITYDTTMCEVGPSAAALFRLLSWFASDPLPIAMLETAAAAKILNAVVKNLDPSAPEVLPDEALAELAAFSMVKRIDIEETPCFSQHRLVQELTQQRVPLEEKTNTVLQAGRLLTEFAPKDPYRFEVWKDWKLLISHSEAIWERMKVLHQDEWNTAMMDGLALYYLGQGRYDEAIPIQRQVLQLKIERLGVDKPETLLAKNDLALLLNSSGNPIEAQTLYREAIAQWEKVGTTAYEEIATEAMHNLGFSLLGAGQLDEAELLLRKAFAIFQRISGEYHWRTLMTEYSLAQTLLAKGETEAAISVLRVNIEKKATHLPGGENHPDTLDSIQSLADEELKLGHLEEAELLAKRAVAGRDQSLGKDDSATVYSITTLIAICMQANKLAEAMALRDRLINTAMRVGNPADMLAIRELALECFVNGDYSQTERLLRGLLEKRFEMPGNQCHLARVLIVTGREREASEEVAKAWHHRAEGPPYVIPRILWLQLALAISRNGNIAMEVSQTKLFLGRLKTALRIEGAFAEWTMQPVLDHWRPKLAGSDHALLTTLVNALRDRANLPELEGFDLWRDAEPEPLE